MLVEVVGESRHEFEPSDDQDCEKGVEEVVVRRGGGGVGCGGGGGVGRVPGGWGVRHDCCVPGRGSYM